MKGVARISFQGGGLFLPVKTPYERKLFFEHIDLYARRHGQIRVELNRTQCSVSLNNEEKGYCAACERLLDQLTYAFQDRSLCGRCARRDLS